jgi:hypothetical protein
VLGIRLGVGANRAAVDVGELVLCIEGHLKPDVREEDVRLEAVGLLQVYWHLPLWEQETLPYASLKHDFCLHEFLLGRLSCEGSAREDRQGHDRPDVGALAVLHGCNRT